MPLRTVDRCGDPTGVNFPQLLASGALMLCQPFFGVAFALSPIGAPSLARAFGSRSLG